VRILPQVAIVVATLTGPLQAQDTTRAVLRLLYDDPRVRPGLVVLPAPGLDSIRTIVERDLDFSDRFELIPLPAVMQPPMAGAISFAPYRAMNAALAVELAARDGALSVRLWDVMTEQVRRDTVVVLERSVPGQTRMTVHRLADELVHWATGTPGIAATRILFVSGNRIWRIDSDGHGAAPLTPAGRIAFSPAWSPDGQRFAFTEHGDGRGQIVLQTFATGTRTVFPTTATTQNLTPAFSADGRRLAFSRVAERAWSIHQANVADLCCVERLTPGRFAENISPTYSPDARRLAFVSSRAGSPQIYVMSSDGTDQELLVAYDYGGGGSFAPEWSPDGLQLAFHREAAGSFQVMTYDLTTDRARQVTSEGKNEDPSWAPDARHLVFVSNRVGRGQLHVIDLETGRVRILRAPGVTQVPAWSRRLGGTP
jgi:TolB protein